jgi:predicted secreted protein
VTTLSWPTLIAIYFIVWWITLFCILPLGVRTQAEAGDIVPGSAPSAPVKPQLLMKAGLTTIVAAIVVGLFLLAVRMGLTLDDFPI